MRLSFQGCLILLLCFFFSSTTAAGDFSTIEQAAIACVSDVEKKLASGSHHACIHKPDEKWFIYEYSPSPGFYQAYRYYTYIHACSSGQEIDIETGTCIDPAPDPQEPAECYENGLSYNNQTQQCVEVCEHGELNGACLAPPEDNTECTKESPDYRGEVVIAYGQPPIPACGDFDQCSGDQPGQVGFFNGELRCLPEDFGVPECKGDSITVVDEYGFVCEPLTNKPEQPETPEQPNTDTDGDGQPDEYDPDNDPNIQRKQLDSINDNQEQANDSLSNLENIGKGTNSRLDDINSGVSELVQMGRDGELGGGGGAGSSDGLQNDQGEDYLGDLADIKQNTKDTADALQGPEGGFDISGWLDAPTFEQSINGFGNAVSQSQIGQLVSGVSNIPSSSTCPVYVIPGTDYWEPMNMDVHCDILENHRATLSVLFMFFWTVSALFLFFRA